MPVRPSPRLLLAALGVWPSPAKWIEHGDPQAADRFYKQLVRCCGSTDLGREADELRWFPEADACPAPKNPTATP